MTIKEKLSAVDAHLAAARKQSNPSPETLAVSLLAEAVSDLASVVAAQKTPKPGKAAK